jgi:hypothetical protein
LGALLDRVFAEVAIEPLDDSFLNAPLVSIEL